MLFLWEVDIRLNFTIGVEELEGIAINIEELIFDPFNNWSINHITSVISAFIAQATRTSAGASTHLGAGHLRVCTSDSDELAAAQFAAHWNALHW